ncbi:MAG: site-2 protease family protein, partial [Deltaproteobacteria bacterium]|nr:site-2 protease family protein [Deltaproteobacteria bacterium]
MTAFLYFILLLGALIFFHELGHFIFAKLMGVRVLTFSIGFGPKILKFIRNGTTYCVSLIPLGGYVKMFGEELDEIPIEERNAAFNYKPVWMRTLIVLAGPVFNLILPFLIFFLLFFSEGTLAPSVIGSVTPEGPAWKAGLRPGDRITGIDGMDVKYWWEVLDHVTKNPQKEMDVAYERDGRLFSAKVTPALVEIQRFKELDMVDRLGRIEISPVFVSGVILVEQGGAAERAGLRNWDLITGVDGADVKMWEDIEKAFKRLREGKPAGSVVKITVKRMKEPASDLKLFDEEGAQSLDFNLSAEDAANPGVSSAEMAIYSVEDGGTAADAGLKKGDVLLSLNGQEFNNFQFFIENTSRNPDRKNLLKFRRGDEVVEKEFTL